MSDELTPPELTAEEIEELGRVMRGLQAHSNDLEAPPAHVWESIQAGVEAAEASLEETSLEESPAQPRSRRLARYALAAAVLAIAALGLGSLLADQPDEEIVATVEISNEGLADDFAGTGTVNLVSVDGKLRLDLDVEQLETDTGFFELWVARPDASEVGSVGVISGDGSFDWPQGFPPDEFPAIAISLEEDDGDPSFGGRAVLFGVLDL